MNGKLQPVETALESPAGIAAGKIVLLVFGVLVTTLLALILTGINRTNSVAEAAREGNYKQDQDIALLKVQTQAIQRQTDATVAALQALTLQVTKNQDDIQHTRSTLLGRDRPAH